jgi:DNA-binding Lrp family transcriptional regulator
MLSPLDKKIIRRLQGDIPLTAYPYKDMAKELDIDEDELISRIKKYNETGILKRISAILYHRQAGFNANAMVVWKVNNEDICSIGEYMSSIPEVSHCYERITYSFWDYNLYTMIHHKNIEKCNEIIQNISTTTGITDYKVLYSTRELKKTSMNYFK